MAKKRMRNRLPKDTHYNGPVRLPTADGLNPKTIKVNLTQSVFVTANGSGIINNSWFTSDVASTTDWTQFQQVYAEYRVLAMEVRYFNHYNGAFDSGLSQASGAVAPFHTPSWNPTSPDAVFQSNAWKPFYTSKPFTVHWKAYGTEEMQFEQTSSPLSHGGITYYVDGAQAGSSYGRIVVTFLVEFKDRR